MLAGKSVLDENLAPLGVDAALPRLVSLHRAVPMGVAVRVELPGPLVVLLGPLPRLASILRSSLSLPLELFSINAGLPCLRLRADRVSLMLACLKLGALGLLAQPVGLGAVRLHLAPTRHPDHQPYHREHNDDPDDDQNPLRRTHVDLLWVDELMFHKRFSR